MMKNEKNIELIRTELLSMVRRVNANEIEIGKLVVKQMESHDLLQTQQAIIEKLQLHVALLLEADRERSRP